jgi:hypothetical protein
MHQSRTEFKKEAKMSDVEYVNNYIIVNSEGEIVYDDVEYRIGHEQILDTNMKNQALNTFQTFYMCAKQQRQIAPNIPISSTTMKLRVFAPNRAAAEKAAMRQNNGIMGMTYFHWIESA